MRGQLSDPWRGKREYPVNVGGRNEMPGRAQDMSPEYPALANRSLDFHLGDTGGALCDGPFGGRVVLRLDCAHRGHHFLCRTCGLSEEMLVREPESTDLGGNIARSRHFAYCALTAL